MRDGQTIMNKKRSLHNLNQGLLCKIRSTTQKWLLKRIGKNSINHQTKVIEKGTSIITETQARKDSDISSECEIPLFNLASPLCIRKSG